jgi:hypothetical protein
MKTNTVTTKSAPKESATLHGSSRGIEDFMMFFRS